MKNILPAEYKIYLMSKNTLELFIEQLTCWKDILPPIFASVVFFVLYQDMNLVIQCDIIIYWFHFHFILNAYLWDGNIQ